MTRNIDDLNITGVTELIQPDALISQLPSDQVSEFIYLARKQTSDIIACDDDRLLVVVGPCSIHDPDAALEYASKLAKLRPQLDKQLHLVMRVYFEKPRTIHGWKGLINDPDLDETFHINKGLKLARNLLLEINRLGVPCAVEYLDTISPQFLADLVTWGAIGARTTESQVHRELASGLSSPVGFKNGTDGNTLIAAQAMLAASRPHTFLSVTKQGNTAIFSTRGNRHTHIILRGGSNGPNYHADSINAVTASLDELGIPVRIMIDCSHANSGKNYRRQPDVAAAVATMVASGNQHIIGAMLESHLQSGRQDISPDMAYGISITDSCLSWQSTIPVLEHLADAVTQRHAVQQNSN